MDILFKLIFLLIFLINGALGRNCDVIECKNDLNALRQDTTLCSKPSEVEAALLKCVKKEDGTACDDEVRLAILPDVQVVEHLYESQCKRNARAAQSACNLGTTLECVTYFASATQAPNFPLDDMGKFCKDLVKFTELSEKCVKCAAEQFFPEFKNIESEYEKITSVILSLSNGGCDCANKLNSALAEINGNGTCTEILRVKTVLGLIIDECVVPKVNEFTEFNMQFLTDSKIDAILGVAHLICLLINGGTSITASTSTMTIILGGAFIALTYARRKE